MSRIAAARLSGFFYSQKIPPNGHSWAPDMIPTKEELIRNGWPDWIKNIFPMTCIYYKPQKPRPRRRRDGFVLQSKGDWPRTPPKYKPRYGQFKKASTRDQNNFSYVTCCVLSPDGMGTVFRSLKHKGYSRLIAMVYSIPEEISRSEKCWRYIFSKYKSLWEIYHRREVYTAEMKDLFERLEKEYPSKASGQLRLF